MFLASGREVAVTHNFAATPRQLPEDILDDFPGLDDERVPAGGEVFGAGGVAVGDAAALP